MTMRQLKEAFEPPRMRAVEPHGQLYEPVNRAYFDWYWRQPKAKSEAGERRYDECQAIWYPQQEAGRRRQLL